MYLLSLLRGCFHVVEIGRVPSIKNIRSVSRATITTADSAVCTFYLETKILFSGSSIFSFWTVRTEEKRPMFRIFRLRLKVQFQKKNRHRHSSIFFQDVILLHQK